MPSVLRDTKKEDPQFVTLYMEAQMEDDMPASNVLGEIKGASRPDEVVAIGCHLDSWDVGQGAQDDGAGCAIKLDAVVLLHRWNSTQTHNSCCAVWK